MIDVFIQFGDDETREIGLLLRTYLLHKTLRPFLAGQGSPDIPAGTQDFWAYIRRQILISDVMVSICNDKFEESCGVQKEFKIIEEERDGQGNQLPRIPFIKEGCDTPRCYEGMWHPLYFTVNDCEKNFCELLNEIYRCAYNKSIETVAEFVDRMRLGHRGLHIVRWKDEK